MNPNNAETIEEFTHPDQATTRPLHQHRALTPSLPSCPICSAASLPLLALGEHDYLSCPNCSHQFLDFEPIDSHTGDHFGEDYFSGDGDGYPDYLESRDLLIARGKKYAKKIARLTGREPGKLLDIGSAAGFLAKGFQSQGWGVQGIEPSLSMAVHATRHENVPTSNDSLEDYDPQQQFDLVLLIQVIAHLEDPAESLRKIRALLKPGGQLLIETWDSQSLTAKTLGRRWHEYNPPSVLHAFSRQSLATLAEREGFKTVASKRTTKRLKAAHAKALLEHKYGDESLHRFVLKPALALLPNRLAIPYPADDLFWTCLTPTS